MKKIVFAALLVLGITAFAQESNEKSPREKMEQLSPEQRSQMKLKRLTKELGLNESQQKEIGKIIADIETNKAAFKAERMEKKTAGIKPTPEERLALKNRMLDQQKATKEKISRILNPEQLAKWDKIQEERKEKMEQFREKKEKDAQMSK